MPLRHNTSHSLNLTHLVTDFDIRPNSIYQQQELHVLVTA